MLTTPDDFDAEHGRVPRLAGTACKWAKGEPVRSISESEVLHSYPHFRFPSLKKSQSSSSIPVLTATETKFEWLVFKDL